MTPEPVTVSSVMILLLRLALLLAFLSFPVIGIVFFVRSLKHRLPDIPLSWALKTGLSRVNFNETGLRLRRRAMTCLFAWILVLLAAKALQPFIQPANATQAASTKSV